MDSPWDSPQLLGSPVPWHPTKDSACGAASYQIARPHAVTYDNEAANPSLDEPQDFAHRVAVRRRRYRAACVVTSRREPALAAALLRVDLRTRLVGHDDRVDGAVLRRLEDQLDVGGVGVDHVRGVLVVERKDGGRRVDAVAEAEAQ